MKLRTNRLTGLFALALLTLASPAFADQHEKSGKSGKSADPHGAAHAAPTPEMRAAMTDAHQRMAECLRSNRPVDECRAELHKACSKACGSSHGKGECPMGGHGMHDGHHGHHGHEGDGHGMTHGKSATSTPAPTTSTTK